MRICLYTETALPKMGGQEWVVDALARHYQQGGHDVVVLAPHPRRPLRARDEELPYPVVRHPRFFSTRLFVPWYRWFLNRLHSKHRTEILHCHGVYPPAYLAGLSRAQRAIPTIVTSHGGDVHADNVRLCKPALRPRILLGLSMADTLVAISRFTADRMRALCPQAHIVSIPNGVDRSPYAQAAGRIEGLAPEIRPGSYLLFLGRLKERKGVDVLLHALSQMTVPGVPLVIAGAGEERPALEALCARLGLRDRVYFVGAVQHPAKAYLLQHALATVVPSRTWEAFPLVVLESYAAGTPVLASRLAGLEDVIDTGTTGWLVTPENPRALAGALDEACRNREHTRRLGEHARQRAQEYDWSVIAARHLELYREVLARATPVAA